MRIPLLLFALAVSCNALAQSIIIEGTVRSRDRAPLVGATVLLDSSLAVYTDVNGAFAFTTTGATHRLTITYVGFERFDTLFTIAPGQMSVRIGVSMRQTGINLGLVAVSASRYEKNIAEETVSISVLKPGLAQSTNAVDAEELVNRAPGINIVDGQANIRGGSGYSYGAGSRVLVLVDDIPQLTGDAGDVKWDFLPLENLEQIEIIKGAASTLYGSSAVNGVVNIRTAYPTGKPQTNITVFQGLFGNPANEAMQWWNHKQPFFQGASFMHKRRIGALDLVTAGNVYNEESFLKAIYIQRARANANLRYRVPGVEGLSVGLNTTYYVGRSATFFLWEDDSLGAFIPQGLNDTVDVINHLRSTRVAVDPYVVYLTRTNTRHTLKGHFFRNDQPADLENQSTTSTVRYAEYQFNKPFKFGLHVTAGFAMNGIRVSSDLYGDHDGDNQAGYVQLDYRIGRLGLIAGAREEFYRIDTVSDVSPVVLRAGLNYKLFEYTHVRASFGQGYRFPTVAEKYVKTNAGSLYAYPNPDLQPETSWSAEVGLQQGYRFGRFEGYADIAAFTQHLDNFMEFTLGQWGSLSDPFWGLGFRSENVDLAIVSGIEANLFGSGNVGASRFDVLAGFTYINPIDVEGRRYSDSLIAHYFDSIPVKDLDLDGQFSEEEVNIARQKHLEKFIEEYDDIRNLRFLKYRYTTTFKFDVGWSYKRVSFGVSGRYNSFMIRIDPFLEVPAFIRGIGRFREEHPNGDWVFDVRTGVQVNDVFKVSFIVKNVTNTEYWDRPARLNAPRNYTLQLLARF